LKLSSIELFREPLPPLGDMSPEDVKRAEDSGLALMITMGLIEASTANALKLAKRHRSIRSVSQSTRGTATDANNIVVLNQYTAVIFTAERGEKTGFSQEKNPIRTIGYPK
jgi:hypothetical protein